MILFIQLCYLSFYPVLHNTCIFIWQQELFIFTAFLFLYLFIYTEFKLVFYRHFLWISSSTHLFYTTTFSFHLYWFSFDFLNYIGTFLLISRHLSTGIFARKINSLWQQDGEIVIYRLSYHQAPHIYLSTYFYIYGSSLFKYLWELSILIIHGFKQYLINKTAPKRELINTM